MTTRSKGYKPYQVVVLKGAHGKLVELMSFPFGGQVFARTEIGDPTSAKYLPTSRLGKVVAQSAGDLQ